VTSGTSGTSGTSWDEARLVAAQALSLVPATRDLTSALGSWLASDLSALSDSPSWPTAAMDGYAVCGAGPWRLVGAHLAGESPPEPLTAGTCISVTTGSPVPEGCAAVVPHELGHLAHGVVQAALLDRTHIRTVGEEHLRGDVLLSAGARVTPVVLGLAAVAGHDGLLVRPRPRVRVIVTGEELLDRGLPRDGMVRDALGPMLPALLGELGADVIGVDRAAGAAGDLADRGEQVLLCTGATSHGPRDYVRPTLVASGAQLLVGGVDVRPGHPMLLARQPDGRLVVGVPGNPLAALACLVTLVEPLLAGRVRELEEVRCAQEVTSGTRLVPACWRAGAAEPLAHSGAAMLRGVAAADGLVVLSPGSARWWPLRSG
jgi:molybdopterin molybdotransferase